MENSEAIERRHEHIGQNEIGMEFARCFHCLFAIGDGVNAVALAEQALQVVPHVRVVIGQND